MNVLRPQALIHDRYRILNLLGQGGFGAVYAAIDERLQRRVAIKQLLRVNERISRQFEREAHLLANLVHPGMPRVTDHFSDQNGQFLVMDYVPGDDLAALLMDREGPFPVGQVLAWGYQLLDVLHYLHTRKPPIIHRDIKPQNLKLQDDGKIMLLDFGLAKGYAGDVRPPTSESSLLAYTKGYAPPEQVEGTGTDERSDLYALGATLYCLLTNVAPLEAQMRLLAAARNRPEPLPTPHSLNPEVPEAISDVVMQALALDPGARPASAQTFQQQLHAAQISSGLRVDTTPAPLVMPSVSEPTVIDGAPNTAGRTGTRSQLPQRSGTAPFSETSQGDRGFADWEASSDGAGAMVDGEPVPLHGVTHFWWVRVPQAARRVSSTLAAALVDGHYIAAYLRRSLFAAPLTLFVGLLAGWLHPDFEFVAIEALVLISVLAALSTLSGHLGALFLIGFALGDFVLASHDEFYVRGFVSNLLYVRLPLLIQYALFGLLLVTIPLLTKAMVAQLLPSRRVGRQVHILIGMLGHALITFVLVYLWTQAMPLLIQPIFTWPGSYVRRETIEPLLSNGYLAAGAALIASATRMVLQYRAATLPQLAARMDQLEQHVSAVEPMGTSERRVPRLPLVLGRTLWSSLLLAGLFQSWFTAIIAIPVIFVLQATRAELVPAWSRSVQRIPLALRVIGGGILLVLLTRFFAGGAELGSYYTPPPGLLIGTAVFAALIIFGRDVFVQVVRGLAGTVNGREAYNAQELAWWRRLLGITPLDVVPDRAPAGEPREPVATSSSTFPAISAPAPATYIEAHPPSEATEIAADMNRPQES